MTDNFLLNGLSITFELFASEPEADLRGGNTHMFGSLEDEFFLKLNPEKFGTKSSVKDSQIIAQVLCSVMRRKFIFDSRLRAQYLLDFEFGMVCKTS